jgi:hypothetical protein
MNTPAKPLADAEFTLEQLMDRPGEIGRARAAARFHNNTSAKAALAALNSAIRALRTGGNGDDAA